MRDDAELGALFALFRNHEEKPGLRALDEHSHKALTAFAVIGDARAHKIEQDIERLRQGKR